MLPNEFYLPELAQVRRQSRSNRQGRGDALGTDVQEHALEILRSDQVSAYESYDALLKEDISRELARINLPVSAYTQWYWQIDLHNLFHFLRLRLDSHAQYEIRVYAEVMASMAKAVAPIAFDAFEEHLLGAVRLSRTDTQRLRAVLEAAAGTSADAASLLDTLKKDA